jgi:hypothetical protein
MGKVSMKEIGFKMSMGSWMQEFYNARRELFFLELEREKLLNTESATIHDSRIKELKQVQDDLLKKLSEGDVTEDEETA